MTRRLVALGLAGVALLGIGSFAAGQRMLEPVVEDAPAEVFTVERGAALKSVARRLEERGIVRSALAFEWLARARGLAGQVHVGEYDLAPSWPARVILKRLTEGRVKTYEVVLPEGIRAREIAARLAEHGLVEPAAFRAVVEDAGVARALGIEADGLEGYLYPETYRFPRGLSAPEIAGTMVRQFEQIWARVAPLADESGLSRHEIVTLASIVEKETAAPEERPLIAAVFLNRLRRKMRLETDPSVIYGIADFDGNLTRTHLRDRSNPYNTYRIAGLPPGPIASPGIDALRAVVQPAETDYLYFVSRNDGTHEFSRSYREHARAVDRYQRRRRSR